MIADRDVRRGETKFNLQICYDAWSIQNAFMGPILIGDLRLLTDGYTITFVFELQHVTCQQLIFKIMHSITQFL